MWSAIAVFILRFRLPLLLLLLAGTAFMGWRASRVQVGYEFTRAIPVNNPKFQDYQRFREVFGEDGNTMVVAVQTERFFEPGFFQDYKQTVEAVGRVRNVEGVLSVPGAMTLYTDTLGGMKAGKLMDVDSAGFAAAFAQLTFYRGFLYNPATHTYLAGIRINKDTLNSKGRMTVINGVRQLWDEFGERHRIDMHYSGLPHIRTDMATRVQAEMRLFIILSFALTALILFLFFRSILAVIGSMLVVAMGVAWSVGTLNLLGYNITILTALIPPLIVVIGIPNCVYFLNKYHSTYNRLSASDNPGDVPTRKRAALITMVEKMAIVTLFTNLTAAIGFGVFFFTESVLLKEFGLVAGINLMSVFLISLIFLPIYLSYTPPPGHGSTRYMEAGWISRLLDRISNWVFHQRRWVYGITAVVTLAAAAGMLRLRAETHIVDDLPKGDKVYTDLKFFETNFGGVMPLEIVVDAQKKYRATAPEALIKIDSMRQFLADQPEIGHVIAVTEGIKFAAQAANGGDSSGYTMPDKGTLTTLGVSSMLRSKSNGDADTSTAAFRKLLAAFIDSTGQRARISANMADIGSVRLDPLLKRIQQESDRLFPKDKYTVTLTGTTPVFLEGSTFIINSLRDSILLAFLMIFGCMILLFRSWRILLISILVNVVPLAITAGMMGWFGIPMKPSTVLVFSVALGITIDVTIRFLVSYRQELAAHNGDIPATVRATIHDTGLSIIYTSLILVAGFAVFCVSRFDGTKSLGYLTSLTLLLAMITNLTLQPALLLWMGKSTSQKSKVKR